MGCVDRIKEYLKGLRKKMKENKIAKGRVLAERNERLLMLYKGENLPIVLNQIVLHKDEVCHCKCFAQYGTKTITTRHTKDSGGASIRIIKGFSVHIGSSRSRVIKKEVPSKDPGQLFITNKRIIFTGKKKNFTVTYPNIIAIKTYNDGFELQTENISYGIFVKDDKYVNAILNGVFSHIVL